VIVIVIVIMVAIVMPMMVIAPPAGMVVIAPAERQPGREQSGSDDHFRDTHRASPSSEVTH
jgi:hypothetical protein